MNKILPLIIVLVILGAAILSALPVCAETVPDPDINDVSNSTANTAGNVRSTAAQTGAPEIILIGCAVPLAGIVIFVITAYVRRRRRTGF